MRFGWQEGQIDECEHRKALSVPLNQNLAFVFYRVQNVWKDGAGSLTLIVEVRIVLGVEKSFTNADGACLRSLIDLIFNLGWRAKLNLFEIELIFCKLCNPVTCLHIFVITDVILRDKLGESRWL